MKDFTISVGSGFGSSTSEGNHLSLSDSTSSSPSFDPSFALPFAFSRRFLGSEILIAVIFVVVVVVSAGAAIIETIVDVFFIVGCLFLQVREGGHSSGAVMMCVCVHVDRWGNTCVKVGERR